MHQALAQGVGLIGRKPGTVMHQVQPGFVGVPVAAQMDGQWRGFVAIGHLDRVAAGGAKAVIMVVLFVGHRHFEQLAALFAQQTQRPIQFADRQTLMAEILAQGIADGRDQLGEGQARGKGHRHRADLNEGAQSGFEPRPTPIEYRQPHHPILALRAAREQHMQNSTCSAASNT